MEIWDTMGSWLAVDEDLLNFNLEGGKEEELSGASASSSTEAAAFGRGALSSPFSEHVEEEEELEWLSNKDAFPVVETCFGILADNPELVTNHHSPVSVLETTTTAAATNSGSVASYCNSLKVPTSYPVGARSKRRRRTGFGCLQSQQQPLWLSQVSVNVKKEASFSLPAIVGGMGRRCLHCQVEKTPQWRAGPMGPKTLCNACGVRYKSGRLLPEYRPASSPTFSTELHSNSHRKVVEMRRQKEGEEVKGNVGCGYKVG